MNMTYAVTKHDMNPVFNDIVGLLLLCIASGCSPAKLKSLYFRSLCFANKIPSVNSRMECQFFFSISRGRACRDKLTSENVNIDALAVGVWWTASVLTRIWRLGALNQQIRSGDFSLLRDHRHPTSSAVVVYLLQEWKIEAPRKHFHRLKRHNLF